jgi:predicted ATPase with chaperone activity
MIINVGRLPDLKPYPYGYYGDVKRQCRCSSRQIESYRQQISGPLLDRINLHVEVPLVLAIALAARKVIPTSLGTHLICTTTFPLARPFPR